LPCLLQAYQRAQKTHQGKICETHKDCPKGLFCHKGDMGCMPCPCFKDDDAIDGKCPKGCLYKAGRPGSDTGGGDGAEGGDGAGGGEGGGGAGGGESAEAEEERAEDMEEDAYTGEGDDGEDGEGDDGEEEGGDWEGEEEQEP
jgi:hypothetical protein